MKQVFSIIFAMLLSLSIIAQSPSQGDNIVVAEGTQARLSLQTQLSSKLTEVGDQVTATLYEAGRGEDGRTALRSVRSHC